MANYYDLGILPIILNKFKVKHIVISGLSDKEIVNTVFSFCDDTESSFILIDLNDKSREDIINEFTLEVLPNLSNFDAIFLNDDPNWYSVFNELNIIKQNNKEFPLVFICHNIFPHKRRDSYINPKKIPKEYLNEYSHELVYQNIPIHDDYFHALEENTPKNGVLTAIEDFINENPSIGVMNIKLSHGITILYSSNSISKIRLDEVIKEIQDYKLNNDDLCDNIVRNHMLTNHIYKFNLFDSPMKNIDDLELELDEKNKIINDFKNKIKLQTTELNLKNSQIDSFDSKLDLKDTQLNNIKSKLVNADVEITSLNEKLQTANNEIDSLNDSITVNEENYNNEKKKLNNEINSLNNSIKVIEENYNNERNELNNEIDSLKTNITKKEYAEFKLNHQINDMVNKLNQKDNQIHIKDQKILEKENELTSVKLQYTNQFSKLDKNEYCISCYKKEIADKHVEIDYLKNYSIFRKISHYLAYIYLIFKSNPKELSINFKLYNALKNSKCFNIGFYLNNNKDIQKSKWCKYFSPELHYVCHGFNENREFNKKYFNRKSKKELLDYILNCY